MTLGLKTGESIREAINWNERYMKAYGGGELRAVRRSRTRKILYLILKQ